MSKSSQFKKAQGAKASINVEKIDLGDISSEPDVITAGQGTARGLLAPEPRPLRNDADEEDVGNQLSFDASSRV